MSPASLPPRPGRLRRGATGLALALAVPLTMGVSCDTGEGQEEQQEQEGEEQEGEEQDGEEQEDGGDDD